MSKKLVLDRAVTRGECPELPEDLPAGSVVYVYNGPTYNRISLAGIAVTNWPDHPQFYELPLRALANPPKKNGSGLLARFLSYLGLVHS